MKPALIDLTSISLVIAFALLLSPLAQSTTVAPLSLAQLTSSAADVVHAECTGNQAMWRDGEIWTVTSFRVLENWKGNSPRLKALGNASVLDQRMALFLGKHPPKTGDTGSPL